MTIQDWPAELRPRERLIQAGASVLSDAELLAIFLRTGIRGKNAVELGCEMLSRFGSLSGLFAANRQEFSQIPGLGDAKYAQLQAVLELAKRAISEELSRGDTLNSPQAVRNFLKLSIGAKQYESFTVLFLDVKHRLIQSAELARGTLDEASVYPREIIKQALQLNAAAIIIAHNHPSGSPEPSQADQQLTQTIKQAMQLLDLRLLDHFIVALPHVYSFAEHGLL